jgi:dynamin-binding protein
MTSDNRHHHRHGAASGGNGELHNSTSIHSPNGSLAFLPSTTYRPPTTDRGEKLAVSTNISISSDARLASSFSDASPDPHEFYRYNDPFAEATIGSLRSLGTSQFGQSQILSALQYGNTAAAQSTPSLRARKSSFKDLVAKFDNAGESVPPLPPASRTASRTGSPTLYTKPRKNSSSTPTGTRTASFSQRPPIQVLSPPSDASTAASSYRRKPLFGEVVPNPTDAGIAATGYGIPRARRRRGSEGSPMHSPNPMFPKELSQLATPISPSSPTAWYLGNAPSLEGVNLNRGERQSAHRRANSDISGMPAHAPQVYNMQTPTSKRSNDLKPRDSASAFRTSQSRIPVRTRRYSYTSDSGQSSQSSRPTTRTSQVKNTQIAAKSDLPRSSRNGIAPHPNASNKDNPPRTATSPRRKPQTPLQVKSPKRRDGSAQQAEKSPSLRANIIAPPPKISPPLRSSRPRQPVSAASTAASRARMVERISSMQSSTNPQITSRRRPPELKDVDLAARRQRITQAFNRSVEEEKKRKTQLKESEFKSKLAQIQGDDKVQVPGQAPAIVVDSPLHETPEDDVFQTPTEEHPPVMQPSRTEKPVKEDVEADSPTLGVPMNGNLQLLRSPPRQNDEDEPLSAVTAETDGTNFENEPQVTLANHVMQMRSPAIPASPRSDSSNESNHASEGADQESIQIMLRNTAYYEEHDKQPHDQDIYDAGQLEDSNRNSWTSSTGDDHSTDSSTCHAGEGQAVNSFSNDKAGYANDWSPASFAESPIPGRSSLEQAADNGLDAGDESSQLVSNQHQYHGSLTSAGDWDTESPSDNHWNSFGTVTFLQDQSTYDVPPSLPPKDSRFSLSSNGVRPGPDGLGLSGRHTPSAILHSRSPPPRPPSHSPPPVPSYAPQSIDEATTNASSPSIYDSQPPSSTFSPAMLPPKVPRRVTSLTHIGNKLDVGAKPAGAPLTEGRPSFEQPSLTSSSKRSSPTPEQRRLRKRRHVIKELIDTEFTFGRDMRVVIDIYKETLGSCLTLTTDDVKILFGNIDQVARFSLEFLDSLKKAGKPIYVMPRSERFLKREGQQETRSLGGESGVITTPPDQSSIMESEAPDADNDRQTSIGDVFKSHMTEMEEVYTRYLRNHDSANKKLQSLQQTHDVKIWLESCQSYSKDLTSAWNLDSLLVKPVQRILKYPLLLQQLIESTPEDHPDHNSLLESLQELTRVSMEINEKTKQSNLVNQALNRKRKDSDVRTGLSKAFGRRTEKLKQHVGISEMVEDKVYNDLKDRYIENYGQLVVVGSDIRKYKATVIKWVERLSDFAAAADGWVDVHHSPWPELESKLRQFAMMVREVATHALPGHLNSIQKSVIDPIFRSATMLEGLQKDPKGLFQKRDKKLIDYARYSNMRDRGEKLDKKTVERMEQWEALNREAKERMEKLISLTAELVCRCLRTFIQIHLRWLDIWKRRLPPTMNVTEAEIAQIEKDWQQDFDFQEASALSMSICNGSLLAEAVNMVNFLSPSSTTNGDESPGQPSWNSSNKRSISLNSEGSPALATSYKRNSGSFHMSPMVDDNADRGVSSPADGRLRAASLAYGHDAGTPDISTHGTSVSAQTTTSSTARPNTSMGRSASSQQFPRLSLDAPSPYFGPMRTASPSQRPESSSTFFSTTAGPTHAMPSPASQNYAMQSPAGPPATVFSSAMPMSDSPIVSEFPAGGPVSRNYEVLFPVASVYEFNIDRARREAGFPYLTYVAGEIFDVIGERGELWLAKNQDDPQQQIGWIWNKHFARLDK